MSRKKFIIIFNTWTGLGGGETNDESGGYVRQIRKEWILFLEKLLDRIYRIVRNYFFLVS